jgi:hypothetical protein
MLFCILFAVEACLRFIQGFLELQASALLLFFAGFIGNAGSIQGICDSLPVGERSSQSC